MWCESDLYIAISSGIVIGITSVVAMFYCIRNDTKPSNQLSILEDKYKHLEKVVEYNHRQYEKEVLLLLREALSLNTDVSDPVDINSIPGGE